ncbi:hypothetical protein SVAN01_00542 [Stagonosporopsis vannaccii]|nr:hypothetical protein SVAN01_00542 [Stagonosporopsis vannaccii]
MPWLALYLDGASWQTIGINLGAWILVPIAGTAAAIIHAIICLCRSSEHRRYSSPARRRLRYNNNYSADTGIRAAKTTVDSESEPEPAPAPIQRAVAEPAPAPVERAPTAPPAAKSSAASSATSVTEPPPDPIEKVSTKPPAAKSSVTPSSTSVSSSVEKEDPPAKDLPRWKRFQGYGREKEKTTQIGHPVLLETTYDEAQLMRNPNVADLNYRLNAPSTKHYHSASQDSKVSNIPTVSSVYSRPSNDLSYYYDNPTATSPSAYEDISPPDSPEPEQQHTSDLPRRFRSMRDVSPMDENRGATRGSSNIPVLRKAPAAVQTGEVKPTSQKFWGGKVAPNSKVRWDEYSGEPTSSNAGRAGSVNPLAYAKDNLRPMGYQVSVSGPDSRKKNTSFADRVPRFGTRQTSIETTQVPEPWSRATGRAEIAGPLKDEPTHQPLPFVRKPSTRKVEGLGLNMSNIVATNANRSTAAADAHPVATDPNTFDTHNEPIKPVAPLKVGRKSPSYGLASPTTPTNHGLGITNPHSYPSPLTPTNEEPSPSSLATVDNRSDVSETESWERSITPKQSTIWNKPIEQTPEQDKGATDSRFSWTTYNTTTTYQHSPPPSPPQPMPALDNITRARVATDSSVLNRRRPIPQADKIPDTPPARKPVPAARSPVGMKTRTAALATPTSPRQNSTFSTATTGTRKALPQPPTTQAATDHVSLLESQIEDMRVRRSNVYKVLSDINSAAPSNPMLTDFKTARVMEQKKKALEAELAEIKIEEHDIGLKLHRALRKRERDDPNSGSALWIRRVTG